MRLLLDTHVLIWSVFRTGRLRTADMDLIGDRRNWVSFSAASIWEVSIKRALGRSDFFVDPKQLADTARLDFAELPITSSTAMRVAGLTLHHRDPFDRLLVAQAMESEAVLVTADAALMAYEPHVRLID